MQSIQQDEVKTLKIQIEQLFGELVSIWHEADTKKIEAVKRLAARMEELYLSQGLDHMVRTISGTISARLMMAGFSKTAHHVPDYLESKYKQEDKQHFVLSEGRSDIGANEAKNLLVMHKDINQITKEEAQEFHEFYKKVLVYGAANKQLCELKGWALNEDSSLPNKKYEKITTDLPDPKRGKAYNAWAMHVLPQEKTSYNTAIGIMEALERLPPEDDQDQQLADAFEGYGKMLQALNEFKAPFKDLKYATTIKNWWRTVVRYYDHGKHAAGVMDAINSHKYLEDREISVNAINCPEQPCPYFATLSDDVSSMQKQARPQLELLLSHLCDSHDYMLEPDESLDDSINNLIPKLVITRQKITIQVPKERDLTREQVGDKIKELVELAIKFVPAIKAFALLCDWREKTADGRVATRRIDANPKLSDLA